MTIKFTVPEDFSEVTVRQHKAIMSAWQLNEGDEQAAAVIGAICGLTMDIASALDMKTVNEVIDTVSWMRSKPEDGDYPMIPHIELNGTRYGFVNNMTNLTLGEYVDLESYADTGFYDGMAGVLSILYRPIVTKTLNQYTIEKYKPSEDRKAEMEECPMNIALGAMLFFWNIVRELSRSILQSSEAEKGLQYQSVGDGTA